MFSNIILKEITICYKGILSFSIKDSDF